LTLPTGRTAIVVGMTVADFLSLVPVLAVAYGVILCVVVLSTGWRMLNDRMPRRFRRRAVVPPAGTTEHDIRVVSR